VSRFVDWERTVTLIKLICKYFVAKLENAVDVLGLPLIILKDIK